MRDAKVCAENLRTLIERTGKTRHQVKEEAGVEYKALCRWMKHGADHESEGLRKLCGWLGIEPGTLWEPLKKDPVVSWANRLASLLRIVDQHDASVVTDLLEEIHRLSFIAEAVAGIVQEYPDWVPAEFQWRHDESQFWMIWQVARRWHYRTAEDYRLRLLAQMAGEKFDENQRNAIREEVAKQLAEKTAELRKDIEAQVKAAELDALVRQPVDPEPSFRIPDPDRSLPRRRRRR